MAHARDGSLDDSPETVFSLLQRAEDLISGENPQLLIDLSRRAYIRSKRLSYRRGEAYGLVFLGFGHWFVGELSKSTQHLDEARHIFKEIQDREGAMKALVPMLGVQKDQGTYDESLANNLECLEFFRETHNRFWEGLTLLALATLYHDVGDYDQSAAYCQDVVAVADEIGKGWLSARGLVHLAATYHATGNYDQARPALHRSLAIFKAEGNRMGEARSLNDLGNTYGRLGELDQALAYHLEALGIREAIGQRQAQCTSLIHLGRVYLRKDDLLAADDALNRSLALAKAIRSKSRTYQTHLALSELHEQNGDPARALEHYREFQRIKEEVFSDEQRTKLKNLQTRYAIDKADQEMKLAQLANVELENKNLQLENLLAELGGAQAQLVHAEKMAALGKLVAGIAHELNTPTGALRSASVVTAKCIEKIRTLTESSESIEALRQNAKFQEAFRILESDTNMMAAAASRVATLGRSLKNFARLDEAEFQRTDIRVGIDSALDLLSGELTGRVDVRKSYGDVPEIDCYPAELNQLFLTLLTNAAEAIDGAGHIDLTITEDGAFITIAITDDGPGIPKDKLERLFEFDFRAKGSRVKMGAGLVIARNIAHKHRGDIRVESVVGRGTTFTLRLPKELKRETPPSDTT